MYEATFTVPSAGLHSRQTRIDTVLKKAKQHCDVTAEHICRISLERREPTGDSGYKRTFKRAHPTDSPGIDRIDVQRYIYLLKMPRQ